MFQETAAVACYRVNFGITGNLLYSALARSVVGGADCELQVRGLWERRVWILQVEMKRGDELKNNGALRTMPFERSGDRSSAKRSTAQCHDPRVVPLPGDVAGIHQETPTRFNKQARPESKVFFDAQAWHNAPNPPHKNKALEESSVTDVQNTQLWKQRRHYTHQN